MDSAGGVAGHQGIVAVRMFLTHSARTRVKNRIQGILAQYNVHPEQVQDVFTVKGRAELEGRLEELPSETRASVKQQFGDLGFSGGANRGG